MGSQETWCKTHGGVHNLCVCLLEMKFELNLIILHGYLGSPQIRDASRPTISINFHHTPIVDPHEVPLTWLEDHHVNFDDFLQNPRKTCSSHVTYPRLSPSISIRKKTNYPYYCKPYYTIIQCGPPSYKLVLVYPLSIINKHHKP